jgi:hypothetical protein
MACTAAAVALSSGRKRQQEIVRIEIRGDRGLLHPSIGGGQIFI